MSKPATVLGRWLIGAALGTLCFAVTSPAFVRSYLPNETHRGVVTFPQGHRYRWRAEGYATTHIGPHGMPGKQTLQPGATAAASAPSVGDRPQRIALWGDSQAEGVAVDDEAKLFAAIERESDHRLCVYPLARSGDGLGDWIAQMEWAEQNLNVDAHWILLVDVEDLADREPPDPPSPGRLGGLTAKLPAFVIVAARNLLTDASGSVRTLRFHLGRQPPVPAKPPTDPSLAPTDPTGDEPAPVAAVGELPVGDLNLDWDSVFQGVAETANRPVTILHAPMRPAIVHGRVVQPPRFVSAIALAKRAAERQGIRWISLAEPLRRSAEAGVWPHGFHNGLPGVGHLNADGYRVIAEAAVKAWP